MFSASLINDPFGDPGVYVEFRHRKTALLFDLGDLHRLSPRKLLKVTHVFVSHAHMDHFIGFDQLLRVCLGRDRHIELFGPPGFLDQVERRLGAYTWNLVENYANDFALVVTEVHPEKRRRQRRYRCRTAFQPEVVSAGEPWDGILARGRFFSVRGVFLDHRIPCLAFRYEETQRLNVMKNALEEMGLPPGAWLVGFKDRIAAGAPDEEPIRVWWREGGGVTERFLPLGLLRDRTVRIATGKRIAYVTDAICTKANAEAIVGIARNADHLFIEATFLEEDAEQARRKYHLTARQAGALARAAEAKRLSLFHFSPKYKGMGERITAEALAAFGQ